jgi:hypothetical protein
MHLFDKLCTKITVDRNTVIRIAVFKLEALMKIRASLTGARSSPPYEGGVAAVSADGVVLGLSAQREHL